jgi:hypothetical protein
MRQIAASFCLIVRRRQEVMTHDRKSLLDLFDQDISQLLLLKYPASLIDDSSIGAAMRRHGGIAPRIFFGRPKRN